MKTVIITFILSFFFVLTQAQTGIVEGTITQEGNSTVLPGVSVYLENTNYGTITNGNGSYTIEDVPVGSYKLVISYIGYKSLKREINIKANETIRQNFELAETITSLGEVLVMTNGISGIRNVPGSAHYISPKEIQKFSYTDINRTLREVPGINIMEEDGFGLRPNIGLRGTGVERSSKITVMEDGVLMAPAPYAAPAAYYFPTTGRMQAIEILKGSGQIKYGPYTTGGAINLLSTQIPDEFSGRINLLRGSFGGGILHAFAGNSHKNVAYMVETFQYGSDGYKELDGGGNTGFDKKDYLAKIRVNTNPDAKVYQSLTFKIGQVDETSNETYLGLTDNDFAATPYRRYAASQKDLMKTGQSQISVTHKVKLSKTIDILTTGYHNKFSRNWYKLDKVKDSNGKRKISKILETPTDFNDAYNIMTGSTSSNTDALFVKANNREYYAQGVQSALYFNFKTNKFEHKIDIGLRYHQDQIDRFQWIDAYAMNEGVMQLSESGTPGTESNRLVTANAFASYLQYKIKYDKLTLTPGIRYENITLNKKDYGKNDTERTGADLKENNNIVDVFSPGIGLDYQFSTYLSAFAGVHKGFSPPGSNEGSKPEESVNYEIGSRYNQNAFSGQAVIFYTDYSNLLGADLAAAGGESTGALYNGGEVQTKGLELEVTYDLLATHNLSSVSLPLSLIYTYTDAFFENSFDSEFGGWGTVTEGDQLPYLANNQFTLMLELVHKKFAVNISGKYMDEMRARPGQGEIPENEKIDSYFVTDLSANYAMHKNISLFLNAKNLTNEVYSVARRPAGLRPGMPRAFNIGLKATF